MKKRPTKNAGASASVRPRAKKSTAPELIELPPAPPRKRGRPSTYDAAFCERVIELGEEGKSKAQIARALGCSRKSLYLWMKVYPEFAEAMDEAQFAALAWWEDMGQAGLTIPKFNAALYAFNMKNRFREFYADKVDVTHTADEEPEERQLSDLEIARRIAFIFARGPSRVATAERPAGVAGAAAAAGRSIRPKRRPNRPFRTQCLTSYSRACREKRHPE